MGERRQRHRSPCPVSDVQDGETRGELTGSAGVPARLDQQIGWRCPKHVDDEIDAGIAAGDHPQPVMPQVDDAHRVGVTDREKMTRRSTGGPNDLERSSEKVAYPARPDIDADQFRPVARSAIGLLDSASCQSSRHRRELAA